MPAQPQNDLTFIILQLSRIEALLKSNPVHASGPRKPNLSQLESSKK